MKNLNLFFCIIFCSLLFNCLGNDFAPTKNENHDWFAPDLTDSDNDGIIDAIDLDDDNDGIPDALECSGPMINVVLDSNFTNGDWYYPDYPAATYDLLALNDTPYNFYQMTNCNGISVKVTGSEQTPPGSGFNPVGLVAHSNALGVGDGINDGAPSTCQEAGYQEVAEDEYLDFEFSVPVTINQVKVISFLTLGDLQTWTHYSASNTVLTTFNLAGGSVNYSFPSPITVQPGERLRVEGNHTHADTAPGYLDQCVGDGKIRGFIMTAQCASCPDTDGDGTPDYADEDSDNDGCPDSVEGVAGYTDSLNITACCDLAMTDPAAFCSVVTTASPSSNIALSDCDMGGVDNITECNFNGDSNDPTDDCQVAIGSGSDICLLINGDPTHPLATLDCDEGGVTNLEECANNGNPSTPTDDCVVAIQIEGGIDKDNDGIPDRIDNDMDNDGIPNHLEMQCTKDTILVHYGKDFPPSTPVHGKTYKGTLPGFEVSHSMSGSFLQSYAPLNLNDVFHYIEIVDNLSDPAVTNYTFNQPVWDLEYDIRDLDGGLSSGVFEMGMIMAYYQGVPVPPSNIIFGADAIPAPGFPGWYSSSSSTNPFSSFDSGVRWNYSGKLVDQIVVYYRMNRDVNSGNAAIRGTFYKGCIALDTDGDGHPDHLDLDSDNDGIPDAIEACGDLTLVLDNCALDWDGSSNYPDNDGNGCPDGIVDNACATAPIDTDGDGVPDFRDPNSDGDACMDSEEAGSHGYGGVNTWNNPNLVNDCGLLVTGNQSYVCHTPDDSNWLDPCINDGCADKDNDGIADQQDNDFDNDGIPNEDEMMCTDDHIINYLNQNAPQFPLNGQTVNGELPNLTATHTVYGNYGFVNGPNANSAAADSKIPGNEGISITEISFNLPIWGLDVDLRDLDGILSPIPVYEMGKIEAFFQGNPVTPTTFIQGPLIFPAPGYPGFYTSDSSTPPYGTLDQAIRYLYTGKFVDKVIVTHRVNELTTGLDFLARIQLNDGCVGIDTDGDGLPDYADLDSDNDGIPDAVEACGDISLTLEDCMLDNDGSESYPDNDGDTCPDGTASIACSTAPIDTDNDGIPDFRDLDSDNDGCPDAVEAGSIGPINMGLDSSYNIPAAIVDPCGLVLEAGAPLCNTPADDSWILVVEFSACCDLAVSDPAIFCEIIFADTTSILSTSDCDMGGIDNVTECQTGEDPGDPTDDCQAAEDSGMDVCTILSADPTNPIGTVDCDNGGIDNQTECDNGGDPTDPDDDCDVVINGDVDVCTILSNDPDNPLADQDCDNGGVTNQTECDNGGDPNDPSDDCAVAVAAGEDICDLIGSIPSHPLATADCDNGGIDNITECDNGGDPNDPADDCDAALTAETDICALLTADPGNPLATADCDNGGIDNQTECDNNGDPADPGDDCSIAISAGTDICAVLSADPNNPLATQDCDNGGVDNQTECDNNGEPSDPADDCQVALNAGEDICMLIGNDPDHPLATLDCDDGGINNYIECTNGGDPTDPGDDCEVAATAEAFICDILSGDPNNPLATADCDNGGIDNQTECDNGGDPLDPSDDCTVAIAGGEDICAILTADPDNPLGSLDCDQGGVDNQTECDNGDNPSDPADDCNAATGQGVNICVLINLDPDHPLSTQDCDNGGIDNYTECANGGDPNDPVDDCEVAVDSGADICVVLSNNPGHPWATLDCDQGGIDNQTECDSGADPSDPQDDCVIDPCLEVIATSGDICAIIAGDPNHPLATADCDGDGVTNEDECADVTDPSDPCDFEDTSITGPVTADQTDCVNLCPDLTPITTILPGNIAGVSAVGVAVEITELNSIDTDGSPILIRMPSDPRLVFTWDIALTSVALTPVQNVNWNYLGDNGFVHQFQYNGPAGVILAGNTAAFGFEAVYDPQSTDGQTTITASIVPFSGGECNLLNNSDSERLVYFE